MMDIMPGTGKQRRVPATLHFMAVFLAVVLSAAGVFAGEEPVSGTLLSEDAALEDALSEDAALEDASSAGEELIMPDMQDQEMYVLSDEENLWDAFPDYDTDIVLEEEDAEILPEEDNSLSEEESLNIPDETGASAASAVEELSEEPEADILKASESSASGSKSLIDINTLELNPFCDHFYTGDELVPLVIIRKPDGSELVKNRDFTVRYYNNIVPGTARVVITGIGDYTGTIESSFLIGGEPRVTNVYNSSKGADIRWERMDPAEGYIVYRFRSTEGAVRIYDIDDKDTTQYIDTSVRDNCWGRVYHYFIRPIMKGRIGVSSERVPLQRLAPVKITSCINSAAGKASLKWGSVVKDNKAHGYEVQYAQSKNDLFNRNGTFKKAGITGRKNMSKTVSGLKKGKTYWFRVRAYCDYTHSGTGQKTRTWSQYSNVVSLRINR